MRTNDEVLKDHTETYYEIKRKVQGLFLTSYSINTCSRIAETNGDHKLSESLELHSKTIKEIAIEIKDNLEKFVEEENEMFDIVGVKLKEINEKVERLK